VTPDSETSAAPEPEPAIEVIADGRYVVVGSLGAGSQGETLEAVDKREGRPVAIKRFTLRNAKSWKDVELAEREATVLAALNHPHLPRYVEHFEENGALYLVMEKIEGESLAARRRRGQTLDHEQVVRFLHDAAECLRYLHGHAPPIVHRDIKPGNVIRRPDGSYCFVDFGSVRDRLKPEGGSTVVGTFGFMAPEQFQGRAGPGSDVYAVGATALSLLSGREPEDLPHRGLSIDVEAALRGQVDRRLIAALLRMLEPDPDRRATSVAAALRSSGLAESAAPSGATSAEAAKHARRARLEGEAGRSRQPRDVDPRSWTHVDARQSKAERRREREARQRAEREERRARKTGRREARRAERHAHRSAHGDWHRPGPPVPPGRVLGVVILLALQLASLGTFVLFQLLLPLLFTFIHIPARRARMLQIGRAGQRGLERAREHIRYQFLGGPTPSELASTFEHEVAPPRESESRGSTDAATRTRISIDAEAEELDADDSHDAERSRR
jgi:protein kinase-like protein